MTIEELLQELQIPYAGHGQSRHVSPGWLGVRCPYCDTGKGNYGLGIHAGTGACSCWKCGPHGLWGVLSTASGLPNGVVSKLINQLERRGRIPLKYVPRTRFIKPKGVGPLLPAHKSYLRKRGFDPEQIEYYWKIRGTGQESNLPWRLWIPITKLDGPISWTTRAVSDEVVPKYVTASNEDSMLPAKAVLYGADLAKLNGANATVISEGPMDAWAVGPGGTATLGVGWTRAQLLEMAKFPYRVVVFDGDAAAQRRAKRLCDELAPFPGTTVRVTLETGKDASRASKAELNELKRMLK